ncbi:MAG: GntR family transcriptional regulator [Eubacteriales bacterium]|nr:GntR family transcriptional regulator [Eubacteriales bacterium]
MEEKKTLLNTTLQSRSVVDTVIDVIISSIVRGELKPGDKLPTEMELSRDLGVARNSIREAVKILEAYGVLHIKRADGTFVCDTYNQKMLDPMLYGIILQKDTWQDFIKLRTVMDIGTLYVVLRQEDTEAEINRLKGIVGKMEAAFARDSFSVDEIMAYDEEFHSVIAEAAGNIQLVNITDYITRITIPSRKKTVEKIVNLKEADNFISLHNQLIRVIEEKQFDQIEKAVLDHYVYWKEK